MHTDGTHKLLKVFRERPTGLRSISDNTNQLNPLPDSPFSDLQLLLLNSPNNRRAGAPMHRTGGIRAHSAVNDDDDNDGRLAQ